MVRAGNHCRLFEVNGIKLGVVVCEDFWNDKTFWKERLYDSDPTDEVIALGADVIMSINASPYNKGKIKLRCDMVAHRAKLQKKPIVFVNLVGGNDGIIFDGASLIADEEGDIILQAAAFRGICRDGRARLPQARRPRHHRRRVRSDPSGACSRHQRLCRERMAFQKRSSVSPAASIRRWSRRIACEAIGPENVLCVMMPSPFSSEGSIKDSEELVKNLGCESRIEPISDAFDVLVKQLELQQADKRRREPCGRKSAVASARRDPDGDLKCREAGFFYRPATSPSWPSAIARSMAIRTAVWPFWAIF